MKRAALSVMFGLALIFVLPQQVAAKRQITIYTSVTSGAEQRGELARQLVAMVHSDSSDSGDSRIGAATLVGLDGNCLYAVTANHVVRNSSGAVRSIWLRTRWNLTTGLPAKVLPQFDKSADLAVVCVENPSRLLVPLPRIPFFLKGEPGTLVLNDSLTFYGNGDDQDWHSANSAMGFRDRSGNVLIGSGGGVVRGDSGGGLFSKDAVFDELVGIVLSSTEGKVTALDIQFVLSQLRAWGVPISLHDWDFTHADEVARQRAWETSGFVDGAAPPQQVASVERIKRLVVNLAGAPAGHQTGLVVGVHNETAFVLVPWQVPDSASARKISVEFFGGATANAGSLSSSPTEGMSVLAVPATYATVANLGYTFGEVWAGQMIRFPVPPNSPLRVQVLDPKQLTVGAFAYLVGVDDPKSWKVLPREFKLASEESGFLRWEVSAVPRQSIGWVAFDDRNRLIGLVTEAANKSIVVKPLAPALPNLKLPAGASKLESWKPNNLPVEITEAGRLRSTSSNCPFPRLVAYGHQDGAGSLTTRSGSVYINGVSRMNHYDQADGFWMTLDATGRITTAQRFGLVPLRGVPTLAKSASGDVVQLTHNKGSDSCGTISGLGLASSKHLCDGTRGFLPHSAIPGSGFYFSSGSVVVGDSVRAAGLAKIRIDGSTSILAEDDQAVQFADLVRHNDSIYVAGYGVRAGQSEDVVVAAYDSNGTMRWRFFEAVPNSHERARSIAVLSDGTVLAVGTAHPHGARLPKLQLWRLSSSGQLLWKRTYGVSSGSAASDVVSDGAGGAVVAGSVTWNDGTVNGSTDGWLLAVDAEGNLKWQTTLAERYSAFGRQLVLQKLVDSGDGYTLLGDLQASHIGSMPLVLKVGRDGGIAVSCGKQ